MRRSERSGERAPTTTDTRLRWLAAIITLAAAVVLVVQVYDGAEHGYGEGGITLLHRLRDAVKGDGLVLLGGYFAVLLAGAVLHTPIALRRRARIGAGWLTVAVLIAYGLAVAGLAALLAPHTPDYDATRHRGGPGTIYDAMLVCLLGGPAVLVLCGALFPPRKGDTEGDPSAVGMVVVTLGISGLLGLTGLLFLALAIAFSG